MKKLNSIIILCTILTLVSCNEVHYERAMPEKGDVINTIPDKYVGSYVATNNLLDIDTIVIGKNSIIIDDKVIELNDGTSDRDTSLLKKFKKYYVLNFREQDFWYVLPIKFNNNDELIVYSVFNDLSEELEDDKVQLMNAYTDVIINTKIGGNDYLINPSDKAFNKLLKKGVYTKLFTFKRIN